MIVLAIELSSPRGSLALLRDAEPVCVERWDEPQARHSSFFPILRDLLDRNALRPADVDVVAAGRGPGSFSGMRLALSTASAFALPLGRPVRAVSSGEALALRLARGRTPCRIAVVGDARRGTVWCGIFSWDGRSLSAVQPWRLVAPDELAAHIHPAQIIASPHWTRLSELGLIPDAPGWIPRNEFPDAEQVGMLAALRMAEGRPGEPLEPLYLHPPV